MEVKTNHPYKLEESLSRIDAILNTTGYYEESDDIKKRCSLTYDNGYYMNCYALFVDIRDSSQLAEVHEKRVLARLYGSYISELTAIMQSFPNCKEINIVGDCVNGIFTCNCKDDVMEPFRAAFTINGIVDALNLKAEKKGYHKIRIGIGLAKGKALMVQAGYKGSGLNDVIWMGDVVNYASHLCDRANKDGNSVINISQEVYDDLEGFRGHQNKLYQSMFFKPLGKDYYTGSVIRIDLENWVADNQ